MEYVKVEFVFGITTSRHGTPLAKGLVRSAVDDITSRAMENWGGYTLYDTKGGWHDPATGIKHVERGHNLMILILVADLQSTYRLYNPDLAKFAQHIGNVLGQASVTLIVNGLARIVDTVQMEKLYID